MIALGLGSKGWSVNKCVNQFETLCDKAFKKRKGTGFPGLDFLVTAANHSRYETKPLERAFRTAYGEENLFGGLRDQSDHLGFSTKVAVTTTTTNGTVFVLANYNRLNEDDGAAYQFQRAEKPHREIKTWEAARAASAAPRIFKPFDHEPSGQCFQDGAIYFNCPIEVAMRERRLIWPDMADAQPDVVLSLGTSFNPQSPRKSTISVSNAKWGVYSYAKKMAKIAIDHVQSTLNSEQTWRNFLQGVAPSDHFKDRYIRLNLPLTKDPPRLDDVHVMHELQEMTLSHYTRRRDEVKAVANRLLATSFYFERASEVVTEKEDGSVSLSGHIVCRFPPGSEQVRALGEAFRKRSTDAFNRNHAEHNPYFVIMERRKEKDAHQVIISTATVDRMMADAHFSIGQITITLSDKIAETEICLCFGDQPSKPTFYPISGFPRCLVEEERKLTSRTLLSLNLGRKRTPTSAHREWSAPAPSTIDNAQGNKIDMYEAPDYLYPGGITSDAISVMSQRFSSPSPGAVDSPMPSLAGNPELSLRASGSLRAQVRPSNSTGGQASFDRAVSMHGSALPPGIYEMDATDTTLPVREALPPRPPLGSNHNQHHEIG